MRVSDDESENSNDEWETRTKNPTLVIVSNFENLSVADLFLSFPLLSSNSLLEKLLEKKHVFEKSS